MPTLFALALSDDLPDFGAVMYLPLILAFRLTVPSAWLMIWNFPAVTSFLWLAISGFLPLLGATTYRPVLLERNATRPLPALTKSYRCALPRLLPLLISAFLVLAAVTNLPLDLALKPYAERAWVTEPTVSSRSIEPFGS